MTRSPGLRPSSTSMKSLLRRPSWTGRRVALLPPRSTTKIQLPPVSLKKAPLGISTRRGWNRPASAWPAWSGRAGSTAAPGRRRSGRSGTGRCGPADRFWRPSSGRSCRRRRPSRSARPRPGQDRIRRHRRRACCGRRCRSGPAVRPAAATGRAGFEAAQLAGDRRAELSWLRLLASDRQAVIQRRRGGAQLPSWLDCSASSWPMLRFRIASRCRW